MPQTPQCYFSSCLKEVSHFISLVKTNQTLLFTEHLNDKHDLNTSENSCYSALLYEWQRGCALTDSSYQAGRLIYQMIQRIL